MASVLPAPRPIVLDTSCWLEYLARTDRAPLYADQAEQPQHLIVPILTIYEVFKKVAREQGKDLALRVAGLMQLGRVVDIDLSLTLSAALNGLPFADSLIYATAQAHGAILWTQDAHLDGLPGVRYFPKP